jgi:hypothetical protein
VSYPLDHFKRIYEACYNRDAGKVFYSIDSNGTIHSATFVAWEVSSANHLITSNRPDYRSVGSPSPLLWQAICYCAGRTRRVILRAR